MADGRNSDIRVTVTVLVEIRLIIVISAEPFVSFLTAGP
jgi:hypothetical protein